MVCFLGFFRRLDRIEGYSFIGNKALRSIGRVVNIRRVEEVGGWSCNFVFRLDGNRDM